MNKRLKM